MIKLLKSHKSLVNKLSLLLLLAAPFGLYLAAMQDMSEAVFLLLGLMVLGMAAVMSVG